MAPAHGNEVGDSVRPARLQPSSWAVQRVEAATSQYFDGGRAGTQRTAEGHLAVALAEVHVPHAELAALDKDGQVHLQPTCIYITHALLETVPRYPDPAESPANNQHVVRAW